MKILKGEVIDWVIKVSMLLSLLWLWVITVVEYMEKNGRRDTFDVVFFTSIFIVGLVGIVNKKIINRQIREEKEKDRLSPFKS